MGTFGGHALPGSFFVGFALWWTVQMFRRYFASRAKAGGGDRSTFKSTVTFPLDFIDCARCPVAARRWEWEGFFKMFFTLIGFLGEIITATHHGKFIHFGNGQHATMFFFFGLSGLVDILVHHRAPLPEGIEYMISCLAFAVEAVLFKFHLHGRTEFDVRIHMLLLYVVYVNVVVVVLEMRYRHSIMVALARAYTVLLQGTWFWQAGFLLYNPLPGAVPWDAADHKQLMLVTMMFAWHMAAVFVVMVCIGGVVAACQTRCGRAAGTAADSDGSDEVRLLRRNGREAAAGADYEAELDSDSDVNVDFIRPHTAANTATLSQTGDDVIQ